MLEIFQMYVYQNNIYSCKHTIFLYMQYRSSKFFVNGKI